MRRQSTFSRIFNVGKRTLVIIGGLLFLVAIFNISIFNYSRTSAGYSNSIPSVSSRIKTHEDLQNAEYFKLMDTKALLNNPCKYDNEDVLRKVVKQITEANEPQLLQKLKENTRIRYQEQVFADEKKKLQDDFTKEAHRLEQVSHSLNAKLKTDYLNQNSEILKNYITKDLVMALKLNSKYSKFLNRDGNSNAFVSALLEQLSLGPDREVLFNYAYDSLLEPLDPKVTIEPNHMGEPITPKLFNKPDPKTNLLSRRELSVNRVTLSEEQLSSLRLNHDKLFTVLNNFNIPRELVYSGDGIVINGMGTSIGAALTIILQLKELETTYPIELIVASEDEADEYICKDLLPNVFNGKCIVLEEKARPFYKSVQRNLNHSQFKLIAILLSTFENSIVIDASSNTFPIKNIDGLLTSQDFLTTKFLIWPDIWARTTSPLYYDIARFQVGEPVRRHGLLNIDEFAKYFVGDKDSRVLYHDLDGIPSGRTSDSGLYVIGKTSHFKSLLLALYYNLYGHNCYYELLNQASMEKSEKDTIIAALNVFNEPYHNVLRDPDVLSSRTDKNSDTSSDTVRSALIQYFPTGVKYYFEDWQKWLESNGLDTRLWPYQQNDYTKDLVAKFKEFKSTSSADNDPLLNQNSQEPIFLRLEKPLINLLEADSNIFKERNFGSDDLVKAALETSVDEELRMASIMKWLACDDKGLQKSGIFKKHGVDQTQVCEMVSNYVQLLKQTSTEPGFEQLKFLDLFKSQGKQVGNNQEGNNQGENNQEGNVKGENVKGENVKGENVKGENVKGENVKGENVKGENVKGENVKGEKIQGDNI